MATQILLSSGSSREGTATGCSSVHKSRRDLLGAAGFTALAGIAGAAIARPEARAAAPTVAPDADAPLLALCDRFMALQGLIDGSYAREDKEHGALKRQGAGYERLSAMEERYEAERTAPYDEQAALLDKIGALSANTLLGQRARARVLMGWYSLGEGKRDQVALEWSRLGPLFRDLLGEAA